MRLIDADDLKERAIRVSTVKEHCYMKAVGTHEIDKAPTVETGKWIPVTERLPEQFSSVIVFRKTKTYSMLHYSSALGFHFYDSEWGDVTVDNVTHWMPLPEPPKEKDNEV